jgi:hypothetical protein
MAQKEELAAHHPEDNLTVSCINASFEDTDRHVGVAVGNSMYSAICRCCDRQPTI